MLVFYCYNIMKKKKTKIIKYIFYTAWAKAIFLNILGIFRYIKKNIYIFMHIYFTSRLIICNYIII